MDIGLQVLRAKVRGFHVAGVSLTHRIRRASGLKRQSLRLEKRMLGAKSRDHIVAYCLLRGTPYERIERCAPENKPNPKIIFDLMKEHAGWKLGRELTLERVKEALDTSKFKPIEHKLRERSKFVPSKELSAYLEAREKRS